MGETITNSLRPNQKLAQSLAVGVPYGNTLPTLQRFTRTHLTSEFHSEKYLFHSTLLRCPYNKHTTRRDKKRQETITNSFTTFQSKEVSGFREGTSELNSILHQLKAFLNSNVHESGGTMKWFKHYSNARGSNALAQIRAELGMQGYGRYWALLELMAEKFDGESDTEFVFPTKELKQTCDFHRDQDLFKFLSSLNQVGIMSHSSKNQTTVISSRILLELQSRDFKKARSERAETAPKTKIKNKKENKTQIARAFSSPAHPAVVHAQSFKYNFEAVFRAYPKPVESRGKAVARLSEIFATEGNYERFLVAVEKYRTHVETEQTPLRFVKSLPSFCDCWEFWENPPEGMTGSDDVLQQWLRKKSKGGGA